MVNSFVINKPAVIAFAVSLFCQLASPAHSQDEFDLADWLERDAAVLVSVNDFATTYDQISQLPLFSNASWRKVRKLIQNPSHPIVHADRLEKIIAGLDEMDHLVNQVSRIDFAIHDMDRMTWTLAVEADPETLQELQDQLAIIGACLLDAENPIEEVLESDLETLNRASNRRGWGECVMLADRLFLTNYKPMQTILDEEGGSLPANPLANDRAFRTIRSRSSRMGNQEGQVSIYLKPIRVGRLFPSYSAKEWKGYGTGEFPAAGVNFVFRPPSSDPEQPFVLADATVLMTQPKTKRPLMYSYYEPIEIPYLTVKPVDLFAFGRNEEKFYLESCRCYDELNGEGAADRWFENRYANDDRDFYRDAAPRRESYFDIKFFKNDSDPHLHIMRLEQIKDTESMSRYVDGMIEEAQQFQNHKVAERHDEDALIWRLDDEQAKENFGVVEKNSYFLQSDNFSLDSYLVGNQWYVEGEWPESRQQLAHLDGQEDAVDHGEPIRRLVSDLLVRMDDSAPFMIKYYEPESWEPTIAKYADSLFSNRDRTMASLQTARAIDLELQDDAAKEWQDRVAMHLRAQQYRLELTKTIYKSLAKSFGRQLYLYTQDDDELRVLFGCYPIPNADNED